MTLISDSYRDLQRELHGRMKYGAGGHRWAKRVTRLKARFQCDSILDYGCGKGLLARTLTVAVAEYDPAVTGKDGTPEPADLVVCTDVLEHIEPDCIADVLSDLARLTRKVLLVNISTRPAVKVLADGRNAHILLLPPDRWHAMMADRFVVRRWEVAGDEVTGVLTPIGGQSDTFSDSAINSWLQKLVRLWRR